MMQQNNDEYAKNTYLCVADAIQRVCDEELVHEMLIMLHASIHNDWSEFEVCSKTNQYTLAANILHAMKGTIPIFSDKKTEEIMHKTEALLRVTANESDLKSAIEDLRFQMKGFMSELDLWVKMQQKIAI
jgi:HPt (histidine-containing phosphotransfer) domain-containing protein